MRLARAARRKPTSASHASPTSGSTASRRCSIPASTCRPPSNSPTWPEPAAPRRARRRCSISAPFRNADALLHVVRMFRDPSVPHPSGCDRSRARRPDDGRRGHPRRPRRRRAAPGAPRARYQEGQHPRARQGARDSRPLQDGARSGTAAPGTRPVSRRGQAAARLPAAVCQAAAPRPQPRRSRPPPGRRSGADGRPRVVHGGRRDTGGAHLREDRARDRAAGSG